MTTKEMLAEVIRRAALKPREKEDLVDLWDRVHRYAHVTERQKAWIEKIYFDQKLDQISTSAVRRRVVIPTWQTKRPVRHVEKPSQPAALSADQRQVVVAPPEFTTTQVSRIVAVKSTDIQRALGQKARSTLQDTLQKRRPSSKSGTFMAVSPQKVLPRVGFINYAGATHQVLITSLDILREHCPGIRPGSSQYRRIEKFFADGGQVLKIKPLEAARVA